MCINDEDVFDEHLILVDFDSSCHELGDTDNIDSTSLDDGLQIVATQEICSTKRRYER